MKRIFWSLSAVITISIIVIACQKQDPVKSNNSKVEFDAVAAKEWYYGSFKKSAEWQSSSEKGKKLPDWKNAELSEMGNREIITFPLIEGKKNYTISSTGSNKILSQEQLKRIAAASISRVAFIKQPSRKIITREIDYIPDWNYLQAKSFDISKVNILGNNDGFSGRVIVKNWEGKIISMSMLENGKKIKRGVIKSKEQINKEQTNSVTTEQCFEQEFCVWQMDCTLNIYPDGMMTQDCTDWYNTGECWTETWCEGGGDPCEIAGIGCGGDEGGGDEGPDCNAIQEESEGMSVSEDLSSQIISENATTRTKKYHWTIYKQNQSLWKFTSHESGVHVKTNSTTNPWKWQSLEHTNVSREGIWSGGSVECTVNTNDVQLGLYWASIELNYTITASAICRGFPVGGSSTHTSAKIIGINE